MDALDHEQFAVVGVDTGMLIGYAIAADHPDRVMRLAVGEAPLPGITPPTPLILPDPVVDRLWHIPFNQLRETNEKLVRGREDIFFGAEFVASAGTKKLPDETVKYYVDGLASSPDALHGSFQLYRAFGVIRAHRGCRSSSGRPASVRFLNLIRSPYSGLSDRGDAILACVDLYGKNGFEVLCVTDHAMRGGESKRSNRRRQLAPLPRRGRVRGRARTAQLRAALDPGLELTDDRADALKSAHALAIGLRSFASLDLGLRIAVAQAWRAGAAIVAARTGRELARHLPLVARVRRARDPPRPLGGREPVRRLRPGRRARSSVRRDRRLPSRRTPHIVEDAASV
jgi:hypothetical protein